MIIIVLLCGFFAGICLFIADLIFHVKEKSFKACLKAFVLDILLSEYLSMSFIGFIMNKPICEISVYDVKSSALCFALSLILSTIPFVLKVIYKRRQKELDLKQKKTKGIKAIKIIAFILIVVGFACFSASRWTFNKYGGITFDQVVINLLSPTKGTEAALVISIIEDVFLKTLCVTIFAAFVIFPKTNLCFIESKKKGYVVFSDFMRSVTALVLAVCMFAFGIIYSVVRLKLDTFTYSFFQKSTYIEENYVDPENVKITFPEKKRNLIFIYLESIENSYLNRELGGYMDENLMPELTNLAKEGVFFSDQPVGKFGGPTLASGSQWSSAAIINMNSGLPLKIPSDFRKDFGTKGYFMSGAYTIGDVLKKEGYNQTVMFGADAYFAGLSAFFKQHGDFKVFDLIYARKNGLIPKDYKVWWGFEDEKLYSFAKDEITRLYNEGKPFNFVMETADTHFPDGYLTPGAPTPHESQYANVISYSTKETVKFVRWIQEQPFYENTTVVLIGDHPSMDKKFFKDFSPSYKRTTFNLILNPADGLEKLDVSKRYNRLWACFDMYPTTLASLGCTIEGDRLGLGTNLFSDQKTLFERDGVDRVNDYLLRSSDFYTEEIMRKGAVTQ